MKIFAFGFLILLNLALFFAVILKRRKTVNQLFGLIILCSISWSASVFFYGQSTDLSIALSWAKASNAVTSFIPSLFLWFIINFPEKPKNYSRRVVVGSFIGSVIFVFLSIGGGLASEVTIINNGTYSVVAGRYFPLYLLFFALVFLYAFTIVIRRYKITRGISRLQLRYLILGTLLSAVAGMISNILFPLFGNSSLINYGPFSTILLVGFTTYAIIRHSLLDVRLVLTRSVIYGFLLTTVTLSFVLITFTSGRFFQDNPNSQNFIAFGVAILIVFGLDPLKRWLSRITDKIFFQAKVDYTQLLQNLSNIISVEINLQQLTNNLEAGIAQGLKLKNSLILLRDQDNGKTQKFRGVQVIDGRSVKIAIENASPLIQFLREHRHLSLLESLERKIEDTPEGVERKLQEASKAEFERIGASAIVPIFSQDHLVALLTLGSKLSGDSFSNEDLHTLEVLAPQIGSAIQKANLYEEVREFSEGLKVKVDEATKELRDRNVSLQTLQNITKEITRTLDFGKVVQNIANAVATELGFLGAILVFLDEDGKSLRARAVTETSLTKKALKLLPKPFSEYSTDFTSPEPLNLGASVIRSGQVMYSESLAEVLSPPIPKLVASAMQKALGMKTLILVPIVSEERVIGVIEVGARRTRKEITQREIETLQSMADELGVVSRNLRLFDQISKTNSQLEVANKHLQELDRAKSEFVSIASHQLRTPMTGIMGYLSMMTQGDFGKIKPEHQKILVDLLSESQRMIRLINQFLNVSKIEAGKFTYTWKPTQLEELVDHVVKEVEKAASDKGLKLTVKLPKAKLPSITADADKIEDVILNLLDNAIKYTAKGTVTAILTQEQGMLHFAVKDSGIGIKPQDATELFNKFVRGSGIAQIHPDGSGLGLFIAKSIVDAHGGRIWTESEGEGKGSTFQFTLPLKPPTDEPHPLAAAAHVVKPKDDVSTLRHE